MAEIKHCYLNVSKPNVSWLYLPSILEYAKGQSLVTSVLNVGSEHVESSTGNSGKWLALLPVCSPWVTLHVHPDENVAPCH